MGRRKGLRRKREAACEVEDQQVVDEIQPELEMDRDLDRDLENKSRQHNLTSANVRNIIHVSVNSFLNLCANVAALVTSCHVLSRASELGTSLAL